MDQRRLRCWAEVLTPPTPTPMTCEGDALDHIEAALWAHLNHPPHLSPQQSWGGCWCSPCFRSEKRGFGVSRLPKDVWLWNLGLLALQPRCLHRLPILQSPRESCDCTRKASFPPSHGKTLPYRTLLMVNSRSQREGTFGQSRCLVLASASQ